MSNKTIKQMLIDLYTEDREQVRCALVHELKEEAKNIIKPYISQTNEWEKDISALDKQIGEIRYKIRKNAIDRDGKLRESKLFAFSHKSCGDALHDRLLKFDKETNDHIREILEERKKKPEK